ncbi:MAG: hypothetical protein IIB73_04030 [Proteobacteria bacterium]|nr:hypothetical protein [Pseudomonadota bacterium]
MPTNKWSNEKVALKKIQIHFTFQQSVLASIRYDATDENINPSDIVRKIVGLPYKKIQRARIGLTFNDNDLEYLAEHYNLEKADDKEIKRRVMEEINIHYHKKGRA